MGWEYANAARGRGEGRSYRQANACVNGHTTGGGYSFRAWARERGYSELHIARLEAKRRPPERLLVEPLRADDERTAA